MASRTEQKAAARAAREAQHRQLKAASDKRQRLILLGGMLAVLIVVAIVVVVANSSSSKPTNSSPVPKSEEQTAQATVASELAGLPQSGNVLGNPNAKITITEFGDLVCSTCAAFATSTEPQVIASWVKSGEAKLVYRAFDTASSYYNQSQFVNTQVAARSAGLQNKEWDYILLTYIEQPVGGETKTYVNLPYLQSRAAQIKGLNLAKWQAHMTDQSLINAVNADEQAAQGTGATGTPAMLISGPKGSQLDTTDPGVPQISTLQSLISQVS